MKAMYSLALVMPLLSNTVVASDADDTAIRKTLEMPSESVALGVFFSFGERILLPMNVHEVKEEITAIEKQLRGEASDAEHYSRLAILLGKIKETKRAEQAKKQAAELYRKLAKEQPRNPRILAELAWSLWQLPDAKSDESEQLLRTAIQLEPRDWKIKTTMGRFLMGKAYVTIAKSSPQALKKLFAPSENLPPATIASVKRLVKESEECFDAAIQLAPREPEAWLWRATFHAQRELEFWMVKASEGQNVGVRAPYCVDECVADMQELSRLRQDDCKVLYAACLFEILNCCTKHADRARTAKSMAEILPEGNRRSIEQKMRLLEQIVQKKNRQSAAASEALGVLHKGLTDETKAVAALRQAIVLDPFRDTAWDLLCALLAEKKKYDECLDVCWARLKYNDNAHNRLMAAKVCVYRDDFQTAVEHLRAGLRKEPDDIKSNLAIASLLLRSGGKLESAAQYLDKAEDLLKEAAKDSKANAGAVPLVSHMTTKDLKYDFITTKAAFLALSGDPEKGKRWVSWVLAEKPGNDYAKKVLEAIQAKMESK